MNDKVACIFFDRGMLDDSYFTDAVKKVMVEPVPYFAQYRIEPPKPISGKASPVSGKVTIFSWLFFRKKALSAKKINNRTKVLSETVNENVHIHVHILDNDNTNVSLQL